MNERCIISIRLSAFCIKDNKNVKLIIGELLIILYSFILMIIICLKSNFIHLIIQISIRCINEILNVTHF